MAIASGVVLFAVLQVALSGALLVTHFVADPVYADKEDCLKQLEHTAPANAQRVILLGTSRTGFGFAAGRTQAAASAAGTPAIAFNFGVPAAGPLAHLIYLRRLLADGHKPDLLIVEVLPPLLSDLPDGPLEGRMLKGDLLTRAEIESLGRYSVPVDRLRRQWREAALTPIHEHRFKLVGRLWPSAQREQLRYNWGRTPDPNGWNASNQTEVSEEERARGIASTANEYRDVFRHDIPAGPAVAAPRDLLTLCRSERIAVALVVLPEATTFRTLYPPHTEQKLSQFLADLTTEFGCTLTDTREWIDDDKFLDSHHLLRTGAAIFTDRLTNEIILPFLLKNAGRVR